MMRSVLTIKFARELTDDEWYAIGELAVDILETVPDTTRVFEGVRGDGSMVPFGDFGTPTWSEANRR